MHVAPRVCGTGVSVVSGYIVLSRPAGRDQRQADVTYAVDMEPLQPGSERSSAILVGVQAGVSGEPLRLTQIA